jgi:hypothetical protein
VIKGDIEHTCQKDGKVMRNLLNAVMDVLKSGTNVEALLCLYCRGG